MPHYKDECSSRESDSLDCLEDVEMQEREDGVEGDRLLPNGEMKGTRDVIYKEEWHIRTGWVILASMLGVFTVVTALVFFVKHVIISENPNDDFGSIKGLGSFRRPESEYILDPNWAFAAPRKVREYKWTILDVVGNPDGVFRPLLTVDGQFPGPLIECNEGDTLVIEVDNQSVNATSIHFHGLFQNGTNFMDGTTGVTQCPIAPYRKFRYEFTVTGQSGTYYYHGHQGAQSSDGLYGPLVIHSRHEKKLQKIKYATDRVVMLQDYYHDTSSSLMVQNLQPGSSGSPVPNGALLNGMNRRDCSSLPGRMCDNSTAALPSLDLAANANHRLRFINVGAFAWFQVAVDEHQFAVTEVDGTDILPTYESSLMISPAQRYSMILRTDQSSSDAYWLRARMVSQCWNAPATLGNPAQEVKGVIRYTTGSRSKALTIQPPTLRNTNSNFATECKDMNATSFVPVLHQPPPEVADHTYYLETHLTSDGSRLERGYFNDSSFRANVQKPTLIRTIDGLSSGNETFTSMSATNGINDKAYNIKNDFVIQHSGVKTVDLIIKNFDQGNHPMHLHGHKVWVLGQGAGSFPGYSSLGLMPQGQGVLQGYESRLVNLMSRDVATVEGKGWLALRFIADNPGIWAFHCHMTWHSEAGLSMQFLDRVDKVAEWKVPKSSRELCEAKLEDLEKGAAPKDSAWAGHKS